MSRIDLHVPYAEKEAAKRLGARWDPVARSWYVPEDADPRPFHRWLPPPIVINLRGPGYLLASSSRRCWRCRLQSAVYGFILPPGHESLHVGDEPDEDTWEIAEEPSLLCYLEYLHPPVAALVTKRSTAYRLEECHETDTRYWMNHCEHCGAPFGDHETFCEPGQGFLAFTLEDAARITLLSVAEPFAASCGSYSIGVTLFEHMARR